jgi:hypothetical protein
MTTIFCSKKFHQFIGSKASIIPIDKSDSVIGDWNCHLFSLERKKCLIFINNKSYYSLFTVGVVKKDLTDFDTFFSDLLLEQLMYDRLISLKELPIIKKNVGQLILSQTNNDKKTIGTMNELILQFKAHRFYKYDTLEDMNIRKENSLINEFLITSKKRTDQKYIQAKELMKKLIKTCA